MQARQIFQSQRYPDSQIFSCFDQKSTKLMADKNFTALISQSASKPENKQKYMLLSLSYLGLKQWRNLITTCQKGLQFDQKEPQFYSLKGKALGKLGKNHEKIVFLKKAISLNPQIPSYHRNLGSAYFLNQNYEQACSSYDKAIDLQPQNLFNYHNKGSALFKLGKYEEAKEEFMKVLQINSNVALTYSWLADCEKKLGKLNEAQELYKKALQLSGNKVYQQQIKQLGKEKKLESLRGSWLYSIYWLGNKIFD